MLEISVVEDWLSSPGGKVIDLLGNLTTLFEVANNKFRGVLICLSVDFIQALFYPSTCRAEKKRLLVLSSLQLCWMDTEKENAEV